MTSEQLDLFKMVFVNHYENEILIADFNDQGHLVAFANPYLDFDEVIVSVCEGMLDIVDFTQHLEIRLYQFGTNEFIEIGVN